MSAIKNKLKILFFHNTLPEYRIGWFQSLAKHADVVFVFTNEKLNKKDYGIEIDYEKSEDLKCIFLSNIGSGIKKLINITRNINEYDFVELPPIDSFREALYSVYIIYQCKKENKKIGYFWEKWEASPKRQPLIRKIKNTILRVISSNIYKNADVIFSVGKKNKEYFLSNGINEQKIVWLPDSSETPKCKFVDIRKKYQIPDNSKIILYLGRLLRQKGVSYLIKAVASLPIEVKRNVYLLIAGDGEDLQRCKSIVYSLNLYNVCFAGLVDPSIRGNYFSQCDIFVYPVTYYKGTVDVWGLTLNEAIQHGKILIATDAVGSAYELIVEGINGYRVKPEDSKELCEALLKAMKLIGTQRANEKNEELKNKFNYNNMAVSYINSIQNR